jgi:competence protein ComEA
MLIYSCVLAGRVNARNRYLGCTMAGESTTLSMVAGPAKWVAVGALLTAGVGGAVWSLSSRDASQPAKMVELPASPQVDVASAGKEPVLLSQLDDQRARASERAAEVVPSAEQPTTERVPAMLPRVVDPQFIGPPLPEQTPAELAPQTTPTNTPPQSPTVTPAISPEPASTPKPGPRDTLATPRLINVNTATASELELLPDVGPSLAKKIVAYRTEHGPFVTLADLDKVSGIGPKTLEKLKGRVSFEMPRKRP